jgi:NADH:ubiquinone oxidoreductase subunit 6 (subunit J)
MFSPLFWFFAALTLAFGIGVVVNRNPVASALCLVISFMGLAALLVGLDAYLLAVLQVLVYAGAVMVLFLFIIMLLDLRAEARRKFNWLGIAGGGLVALGFVGELVFVISHNPSGNQKFPPLHGPPEVWLSSTAHTAHSFSGHYKPYVSAAKLSGGTNVPGAKEEEEEIVEILPVPNGTPPLTPIATLAPAAPNAIPPAATSPPAKIDDVREIGREIFTNYNFPLQIVGVLLLVSTVGVIILSRRELK